MNLVLTLALLLAVLVVFSAQAEEEEEENQWPYLIHLDSCEVNVDPSYGSGKCKTRKPKGEKVRKMTLTLDVRQEILGNVQVSMVAKLKNNGNWVKNYESEPKDFDSYYTQNQDLLDSIYKFGNLTTCPIQPGTYIIKEYLVDETKFPEKLECGEYMMELLIRFGTTDIAVIKVGAFVECQ
ncbi:uncharacterized protein [Anabrus simplex]|uniref:uncharacterized protein n=1 Tax=Anabrus simplex TaxID=316456 RepID=UPI0035A2A821